MSNIDQPKVLAGRIDAYFTYIKGEYHIEIPESATSKQTTEVLNKTVWDRLPEPALLTGLALFIGFVSRQDFELYEQRGKYKKQLKRARLRVESEYEKRLHQQSPTGAIFALKSMGWTDKSETEKEAMPKVFRIEMVDAGPKLANAEKDVLMADASN